MASRTPLIASFVLIAAMALVSLWAWPLIPATAHVAVHFDGAGRPNGYAAKGWALTLLPLIGVALTALFAALPSFGRLPANRHLSESPAYLVGWIGALLLLAVAHVMIVLTARGMAMNIEKNISFLMALLLIVLGNYLGKTERNDFVGVRTPWTKRSDYAWAKCNRLGGWLFVGLGFAILASLVLNFDAKAARHVMWIGSIVIVVLLVPLSRYYWRRDPDRHDLQG